MPRQVPFDQVWQQYLSELELDKRHGTYPAWARDFASDPEILKDLGTLFQEGYDPGGICAFLYLYFFLRFAWENQAAIRKQLKKDAPRLRKTSFASDPHIKAWLALLDLPAPKSAVKAAEQWLYDHFTTRGTHQPHHAMTARLLNRAFRARQAYAYPDVLIPGITTELSAILKARQRRAAKRRPPRP